MEIATNTPVGSMTSASTFPSSKSPVSSVAKAVSPDPEGLRACLISEIENLRSEQAMEQWAWVRLSDKNALPRPYAKDVEGRFTARLSFLEDTAQEYREGEGHGGTEGAADEDIRPNAPVLRLSAPATLIDPSPKASVVVEEMAIDEVEATSEGRRGGQGRQAPEAQSLVPPERLALGRPVMPKTLRLRDKAHLKFVAGRPCLVCGRKPADPHHLRFAQPRAMARKSSDEFVVPLCRTHHDEAHRHGDEADWWAQLRIDPVPIALAFWRRSRSAEAS